MVQKNGFFRVELLNEESYCHVYPPKEGGQLVQYREITSYLDTHGFSYDNKEVNRCIFSGEEGKFKVNAALKVEFADSMYVDVSSDKMKAVCRFYPGSTNGGKLTVKDIMAGLSTKNICYGINQELIMEYLNNPVFCTDFILAEGTEAQEGKDAWVEYFFNTDVNTKPAYNEDGTVDFHNLSLISEVSEGQLIAKVHPEDRGKNGRNVIGKETAVRPVKPMLLQGGRNIRLSDDRQEAYSEVTGHARLINGQIFVSDVYEVPADVDNSTGDIDYNGNVYVRGSVREGFQVNARGDVIIDGTVEGALIISGGQIVIKRGVNGMNRGFLQADGNIISKFIENTKCFSGGFIDTGSIIHSEVTAKGDVSVKDKKGFITGSVVRAGGKVEAQTIGSAMGADTRIEIGIDPSVKEAYQFTEQEIKRLTAENNKIIPIIKNYNEQLSQGIPLDPKNKEYYIKLKGMLVNNTQSLQEKAKEFEKLKQEVENSKDGKVVVSKDIFPGVTVVCSDVSLTTKEKRSYCYLEKKDGEVVIQNL